MPEIIEIEMYRRPLIALVGERLSGIELPDVHYARPVGADATLAAVRSTSLTAVRRVGKLLLLDHDGPDLQGTLGLRFGMTGRLLIDEVGPIDRLEYSSGRNDPAWDRVRLRYGDHVVAVRDPRRLGSIELEPEESLLGVDAWTISFEDLDAAMAGRSAPMKSFLLNQKAIAGLGNLLADEVLWRAGVSPMRPVNEVHPAERERLAATIREVITDLDRRGGSHRGDSFPLRDAAATCTRDGAVMRHDTVGGRSTWWCPAHQG